MCNKTDPCGFRAHLEDRPSLLKVRRTFSMMDHLDGRLPHSVCEMGWIEYWILHSSDCIGYQVLSVDRLLGVIKKAQV